MLCLEKVPTKAKDSSCLGPLLFIIHLNDFEQYLKVSKAGVYANDYHVIPSEEYSEWIQIKCKSSNKQSE